MHATTYWEWVRSEAARIDSDGCTGVSGLFRECCWEHDLAFYYARDPRDAYRLFMMGMSDEFIWRDAEPITFEESNRRFKSCHIQRTGWGALSWMNPIVWWRWRGVARLGKIAWDKHRASEAQRS